MEEVEVKVLNIDVAAAEEKLKSLNAALLSEALLRTVYLDFPNNSLRNIGVSLRVRKEEGDCFEKSFVCLKKTLPGRVAKVREELDVQVSSFEEALELLKSLGLRETLKLVKKRKTYSLRDAKVMLDLYEGIPPLLEIEAANEEEVLRIAERLGYSKQDLKDWDVFALLNAYERKL